MGLADGEQRSPPEPGFGDMMLGVVSGHRLSGSPVKERTPGAGPERARTPRMTAGGESHGGDQDAMGWHLGYHRDGAFSQMGLEGWKVGSETSHKSPGVNKAPGS